MNTFILKWNPAISSYSMDRFHNDFSFYKKPIAEDDGPWDFNWSVWDHELAHDGDRCFMLRVGDGENNGIVMSGVLSSEPYEDIDWSGKGRRTFYMDVDFDLVADPVSDKVLPTAVLCEHLPQIEWTKGHSGVRIEPDAALALEKLWYDHLKDALSPYAKAKQIARIAHFGQTDKAGVEYLQHPLRVAEGFSGEVAVAALLHDVVEDTAFTLDDLAREGFTKSVLSSVNALTRKEGEAYETYVRRAGRNKIARVVKIADLRDNMNLLRLPELTDADLQRARRYHKAFKYLCSCK